MASAYVHIDTLVRNLPIKWKIINPEINPASTPPWIAIPPSQNWNLLQNPGYSLLLILPIKLAPNSEIGTMKNGTNQ
jgi:hypothetical protein